MLRLILTIFVLLGGVSACAGPPIRTPDPMPTEASFDAPEYVREVKKLDVEVIDQSWRPATFSWPRFNRGMFYWTATVKNTAADSRDICVVFNLLNADRRMVRAVRGCRVVAAGKKGDFSSNAFVDLTVLKQVKSGRAIPFESHKIYYPKS
jgi:hypothetical protein